MTARWLRRLAVVTAFASLALLTGGPSAREGSLVTSPPPPLAEPTKQYGPNPAYRLTPQIDRIIRLAQRNKKEEDKGGATGGGTGGTTFKKTAPVEKKVAPVKKETAPVVKKKVAPVKKETAPVFKKKVAPVKKDTAPVFKKKETAPVKKELAPVKKELAPAIKKETVPIQKEIAPAETTAPSTGPTEEQLQENKAFCAQNPNDPSCSKDAAPPAATGPSEQEQENIEFCAQNPNDPSCSKDAPPPPPDEQPAAEEKAPPATEKICAANPKYPGCDKLSQQPSLGPAPEDAGKVGSICEQNPQLPQCQGTQETTQPGVPGGRPEEEEVEEEAVEGPPVAPDDEDGGGPPGFIPPGAPAPIPPGPPPSPPPADDDEETTGPTIQTVTECPGEQVRLEDGTCADSCPPNVAAVNGVCPPLVCPDGTYRTEDGTCTAQCPEGTTASTGTEPESYCVPQCPEGQLTEFVRCVDQCSGGYFQHQDQCVASCPDGLFASEGQCVASCPAGQLVGLFDRCVESCPEGYAASEGQCVTVSEQGCLGGDVLDDNDQCIAYIDCYQSGRVPYEGECRDECPGSLVQLGSMCPEECPEGWFDENDRCWLYCRAGLEGSQYSFGSCRECPSGSVFNEDGGGCRQECAADQAYYNGQCGPACDFGTEVPIDGACVPVAEIGYEDFESFCVEMLEQSGGAQLPPEYAGATPEETCQNIVDQQCSEGEGLFGNASESAACRERPCGANQVNTDGVCSCTAGTFAGADGQCLTQCPEGTFGSDGQCLTACAGGQVGYQGVCASGCPAGTFASGGVCLAACPDGSVPVGGQCRTQCPYGYDRIGDSCVAGCAPGETRGEDGQCANPCSGGQVFVGGQCRDPCPGVAVMSNGGSCTANCSGAQGGLPGAGGMIVGDFCRPTWEATPEEAIERCMGGFFESWQPPGTPDRATCEVALAERCAQFDNQPGAIPAYCVQTGQPDVAWEPPDVVAEGPPANGEAPVNGEAPPDGAPPPADSAPPADDAAPPEDGTPVMDQPPHSGCPEGTFVPLHPQNGECLAQCPPETVGNDNGYCVAETPDDQPPPPPVTGGAPPVTGGPPASGEPPSPASAAPVTGEPEAPPAKPKKPTLAELTKDAPIPLKLPTGMPVAVVIGIGDYDNSELPAAPQAIGNAAHVVRFLKDDLGLDDLRIIAGRNATLAELEEVFGKTGDTKGELRDLVRKENPSEVIVYVSGRARAVDGGKDVLLRPADADPEKPETALSLARLYNHLAAIGVPNLRLYLDPTFVKGDEVVKVEARPLIGPAGILTPRGWVVLSGASNNAVVPEDAEKPRSLFTESLVTGLRGIADTTGEGDGDGTVTAEELYEFTRDQAAAAAKRGDKQKVPSLYGPSDEPLRAY